MLKGKILQVEAKCDKHILSAQKEADKLLTKARSDAQTLLEESRAQTKKEIAQKKVADEENRREHAEAILSEEFYEEQGSIDELVKGVYDL